MWHFRTCAAFTAIYFPGGLCILNRVHATIVSRRSFSAPVKLQMQNAGLALILGFVEKPACGPHDRAMRSRSHVSGLVACSGCLYTDKVFCSVAENDLQGI